MTPSERKDETLLREALQRAKGPEREAFLDGGCLGNPKRRALLEALLQAEEESPEPCLQSSGEPPDVTTVMTLPQEGPGMLIGRYKLLEKIGEGGFGSVYVAEQREPVKRRVALKIIKAGMDTRQVVARFEAERQALALMDHPHVAKVLDAGATETGRPYFVMELVKGMPITAYCGQEKLGTRERLALFISVCHAIQHAHQKGIIHRDIKPSNILVTLHDGVPVPKVIDFGIAKATQQELTEKTIYTRFQQFIGTPAYMSPEQAEMSGLDVDTRSDIYSLGVLLYELLTGSTPFDTKELMQSGLDEMRRIIRERQPVRPSTRLTRMRAAHRQSSSDSDGRHPLPAFDHDLDWIVMKCLEKDRARRYETANGLAQDIERHLNHEVVIARPPSLGYRLWKSYRRNKLVFAAAGLVGLVLVLGAGVSLWFAIRERHARDREAAARLLADHAARAARIERARAQDEEKKARESELAARQHLYGADMILAGQALEYKNLGRVVDFLNRHRPANDAQRDLRGWEWRYLWEECRSDELATLGRHGGVVKSVAVSPSGRWLASAGYDGLLKVWELPPGTARGSLLTNLHLGGSPVSSVAFSPDGRWLAAGTWTNGIIIFNAPQWSRALTIPNTNGVAWEGSVAFSSDSRLLAAGGEAWDLDTRVPLCRLPFTFGLGEPKVAWLPHSTMLAGFRKTNEMWYVWLFDVRSANPNAPVSTIPVEALGALRSLAFSADGKYLAVGCGDGTVRLRVADDWQEALSLTNHTTWVSSVAFSADGQWLASASGDHSTKLRRMRDWGETATLRGHEEEVWTLAFTPDSQQLLTGSKDYSVRRWPLFSRSRPVEEVSLSGEDTRILGLSGDCPFSVGPSNVLTVWDGETLKVRHRVSSYPLPNVVGIRPSPDGQQLLLTTAEGALWLTPLAPGAAFPPVCLRSNAAVFSETAFSDQAHWLAVADRDGLRAWDVSRRPPEPGLVLGTGNFSTLRFSRDERLLAALTGPVVTDQTVLVWEVASGKELARFRPHRDGIPDMDFSPDGRFLATASHDNTSKVLELQTGREIMTLRGQLLALFSVAFSPDGDRLALGTGGDEVLLWDVKTGREVLVLKGCRSDVTMLRFLPNGSALLAGDGDSLRVWRAPSWAEIEATEKNAATASP